MQEIKFKQVVKVGCGMDVHRDTIVATVRSSEKDYETKDQPMSPKHPNWIWEYEDENLFLLTCF